jgi:hypothetical protein
MLIHRSCSIDEFIDEGIKHKFLGKRLEENLEELKKDIERSEEEPVKVGSNLDLHMPNALEWFIKIGPIGNLWLFIGRLWFFKGNVYKVEFKDDDEKTLDYEKIQLLIFEFVDKDRKIFEKLKRLYKSDAVQQESHHREHIPEHVRIAVWRRDEGKCVRCGSRENLEYDHIVPISKGGSNTARNIELLCEKCNRSKSYNIE